MEGEARPTRLEADKQPGDYSRRLLPAAEWSVFRAVLLAALATGTAAAAYYWQAGLTLSHYDARAHLVVARRILDSLTPGWHQIGAVWLPLPHLLNALPVQVDWLYRTGAAGVAISVVCLAWGLATIGALVARRTGSVAAGLAGPMVVILNPNVLYLQSTPMTEPLLFGLAFLSLAAVDAWVDAPGPRTRRRAGWLLVAFMLTRYEGWFIASGLIGIAAVARRRDGLRGALGLVPDAVASVVGFMVLSRATAGAWFVTGGFYDATNPSAGRPLAAAGEVLLATRELAGLPVLVAATAGVATCLWAARRRLSALLPLALVCAGGLPFIAFHAGHPHRDRYMVPLVVAAGILAALACGRLPTRARTAGAAMLVLFAVYTRPPLDATAPMVLEAQWDTPRRIDRRAVTRYLQRHWDGSPILASMGSLAHYMHQTNLIGIDLRDFVYEDTYALWDAAVASPRRHVRWILIEEQSEGGDLLARRAGTDPGFLAGFDRLASGGGVALYGRAEVR